MSRGVDTEEGKQRDLRKSTVPHLKREKGLGKVRCTWDCLRGRERCAGRGARAGAACAEAPGVAAARLACRVGSGVACVCYTEDSAFTQTALGVGRLQSLCVTEAIAA